MSSSRGLLFKIGDKSPEYYGNPDFEEHIKYEAKMNYLQRLRRLNIFPASKAEEESVTVATLTDEGLEIGQRESPRCESDPPVKRMGQTANLSMAMVDSLWLIVLNALSLILMRSQGNQDGLNMCLIKGIAFFSLQRMFVQVLRTLFNIAHRLHNVLGSSWLLVLETLAVLDRAIHSPHATTQEVPMMVPRLTRDSSSQYADFNILPSLNSQLFESSAMMHISAVKSLISAIRKLSNQH